MKQNVLMEARNLVKEFPAASYRSHKNVVHAVSGVSFGIYEGETLALVGESGCGKSTLGRLLLRLMEPTKGQVLFEGVDISTLRGKEMKALRRRMQIIFQDPYASLDPRMRVESIIKEPLLTHHVCKSPKEYDERVEALMKEVGIPPEFAGRFPHQFSGGQRQRIGIARALALNPRLVVCDEPVSALDVSIQSQVLNLLQDLQDAYRLTYLFISHDLSVVRHISDRVCVMFLGKLCEIGETQELFAHPKHPYTKFLLDSVPKPDPRLRDEKKIILAGEIPSPVTPPPGCRFHTRCPYAKKICREREPALKFDGSHASACHFPLQ